jgi:hypothetical protein
MMSPKMPTTIAQSPRAGGHLHRLELVDERIERWYDEERARKSGAMTPRR